MVTISDRLVALDRLLELVVVLGEDMERGLADVGLTVPRAHLMWQLHHGGPSTQRGLADALRITPRGVTGLVDGLTDAGLVVRTPHPTDRRATLVRLTPAGSRLAAELAAGQADLAGILFGDLPAEQVAGFVTAADAVLARLHERLAAVPGRNGALR